MSRIYILYDGMACADQGTGDASILVMCDCNNEARDYRGVLGKMACYSYETDGEYLTDERWEWDFN